MIRRIVFFLIFAAVLRISAQEIIRGTYSYTYGDNESLVQARQTCKNLAVRDAIESYYVFVESSTRVENFQTKEDLVQSIATGVVQNLNITDQKEEGRTITLTVEGTVSPDQVKQLVEKKIANSAALKDTAKVSQTVNQAQIENDDVRFNAALSKYENRMTTVQKAWNSKQYDSAIDQIQDMQKWLELNGPKVQSGFNWLMYQSIRTRNEILTDLIKKQKTEYHKNKIRERGLMRTLLMKSEQLENEIRSLENLLVLSDRQKMLRKWWSSLCRMTIVAVKTEARKNIIR